MRRTALLLLLAAAPLASAPEARAAQLAFDARIDVVFGAIPVFVSVEGSGVATVNDAAGGPLTALALPAGVFQATALDFPGTGAIQEVRVTAANAAGSFSLTPNGGSGVMSLPGVVAFCLIATCDAATVTVALPLDPVGRGGTAVLSADFAITLMGAPWTKGVTTISEPGAVTILSGFAHGPLSNTGSTAQVGGFLELVTPATVHSSLASLDGTNGYAILGVEFVPEPSSAALLAGGLFLLSLGRGRQR